VRFNLQSWWESLNFAMEMWEDTDLGEGMEALGIKEKTLIINASPSRGAGARNGLSCAGESTLWCDLDDNSPEEPRQPGKSNR